MRRGCLRYSFYDEFSHLFLVPPRSPTPTKTIGKVVLHSCPSVSGSHLWMCISYRLKGRRLSKGEVLVMASEKINDSSSQKCPTVGSSTWWCSRCPPCLGAFCPSLYALLTSWLSALLWWGCRHTHKTTIPLRRPVPQLLLWWSPPGTHLPPCLPTCVIICPCPFSRSFSLFSASSTLAELSYSSLSPFPTGLRWRTVCLSLSFSSEVFKVLSVAWCAGHSLFVFASQRV